jgi:hypothetical protein
VVTLHLLDLPHLATRYIPLLSHPHPIINPHLLSPQTHLQLHLLNPWFILLYFIKILLNRLHRQLRRLLALINDILDLWEQFRSLGKSLGRGKGLEMGLVVVLVWGFGVRGEVLLVVVGHRFVGEFREGLLFLESAWIWKHNSVVGDLLE